MKCSDFAIKERVIKTTAELLKKHGLKGWNMDILAHETGVAKNTLYKIVGSKEHLFEQMILSRVKDDLFQIGRIIKEETEYAVAMNKITEKFVELTKDSFNYMIPSIYLEYPGLEKKIRVSKKEITTSINDFIQMGMDKGLIRNDITPEFIVDLIEGILLHFFRSESTEAGFEKAFHSAMDCLINGMRKKVLEN